MFFLEFSCSPLCRWKQVCLGNSHLAQYVSETHFYSFWNYFCCSPSMHKLFVGASGGEKLWLVERQPDKSYTWPTKPTNHSIMQVILFGDPLWPIMQVELFFGVPDRLIMQVIFFLGILVWPIVQVKLFFGNSRLAHYAGNIIFRNSCLDHYAGKSLCWSSRLAD